MTNPLPGAITRTSGYIISETPPASGYGTIQWNIGNTLGNYTYPFGTAAGSYIPFLFNIFSAGTQSASGNISVSTYSTNTTANPSNRPLPTGVTDLNDPEKGKDVSDKCDDRYWIIDANNYTNNPTADIVFTYEDSEWNASGGSTNNILEDSLRAWRWNGTQWENPPLGFDNPSANTVSASNINTFSPWTLYSREFPCPMYVPNAFSPNGDNENEIFIPLCGCFKETQLRIFDRWGERVFESDDFKKGWNGMHRGTMMNSQVFTYYLHYELLSGELGRMKGNVTLIR
jgi:gliding motility-associated-like protein